MDILYGLLADISKDLVCGALNQLQYSFCFNGFVKELEKEADNLTETRRNVEDRVTHAKRQTLKTAEVIDKWLENANIDLKYVNCLLGEANAKKSCCFGYCPNWIWRYRLGKKLANKKADLQKILQEGRQYIQFERIATIPSYTFDILTEKCMNFDSRKSAFDQLVKALKDYRVGMIGLYGMGGCGKTTLAMEVKKIAEDEHLFDKVIFVPVSSTVDIPRIQEKIASSLQYKFPENQEMERAQRLCMRLTQEKKILMILDDVWGKIDFGRIGIPSSEHHKDCKILITTRSEEVCILMDCQEKIYLPILTSKEAWSLFQNKALIYEETPETIKHLALSISNECKGLPVAIVAVASSLKGKEEVIWRVALNKLKSSKPINIGKGLTDPYKCLQLSYDNIDTEEAKSLFLLCSVFPEDIDIPIEGLIRCAIGLGVVGEVDSYEGARAEVTAAKIKLVSSCLMMEKDDKHVKMHDLVRDVAHWIAKNDNKIIKCELEKDVTLEQGSIRYLWCVKFPNDIDCSNLEFLSIQTNLEVLDESFENMEKLRVLIIIGQYGNLRPKLSTKIFKRLTNLSSLHLQHLNLRDISFLRDMKKLQSLTFITCLLPSFLELQTDPTSIHLPNLKQLEFNKCLFESMNFEGVKRFPFLEEFYIIETKREYDGETISAFFNSFSVLQRLQRYEISLGYDYESPDILYAPPEFCSTHKTLKLGYFDMSNEVIKDLAKKASELFVANIKGGAKNMIPDIFQIEEGMNELKELEIRNCEEIECLVDTSNHVNKVKNLFCELHSLTIYKMDHLRALWHGCLHFDGCFEKLEKLHIEDCPQLTSLFTYVIAQGLVKLKILHIINCDMLNRIVAEDDKTKKSRDEFTIGHSVQPKIFQNLEEIIINECGELKYVFSASTAGGLTRLKMLNIGYCQMLEQIIGDVEEDEQQHLQSNQLRFSLKSTSIPSPPIVHNSPGSFSLSSLADIWIYSCPMLGSLFTTSVAKTLTSLKFLNIEDCDGLKHIVNPARVKRNKKENMVENDHDFETHLSMFSSLKNVFIWRCKSLEDLFAMSFVGDGMMGEQVSFKLEYLSLAYLPEMSHIWVATNNSFTLQHLKTLEIRGCQKLKLIFPHSMLRYLPELNFLRVSECEELRQIIEEDFEDKIIGYSPQPCFPKLESLIIERCHKLKCFASVSASTDLSNLKILLINEATQLQHFIGCEYDNTENTKVQLPQLKLLIFIHLPNFHQETNFLNVKHRTIRNCPNLSLTSTTTPQEFQHNLGLEGLENLLIPIWWDIESLMGEIKQLDEVSTSNSSTELLSSQKFTEKDYGSKELATATSTNSEVDEKSNHETYSQELVDGKLTTGSYLTDQQNPLGETESTITMSQEWDPTPKNTSPLQMNHEDPSISEIKPSSSQIDDNNQSMLESRVDMAGEHGKIETKTLVSEIQEFQKIHRKSEITSDPQAMEQNLPVISSPNMTQNIEEIGRQRSRGEPAAEGARIETSPMIGRLEEYKHLVDLNDSQISLLVEAISAYPHLWNACEKFSDRFQAWMLKTLADMLLFLRRESVGSVNPQRVKEFLKLCDEAVQLGFERSWVDEMRQRVVTRDHKLDQAKARIGELVKRHGDLTQELDNIKKELRSLNDFVDAHTKCFDFL